MIQVIAGGRQTGRTYKLLIMSAYADAIENKDSIIVCHSANEAQRLNELAEQMQIKIPKVITYENAKRSLAGKDCTLLIDNVDYFLDSYFGRKVEAITLET